VLVIDFYKTLKFFISGNLILEYILLVSIAVKSRIEVLKMGAETI